MDLIEKRIRAAEAISNKRRTAIYIYLMEKGRASFKELAENL